MRRVWWIAGVLCVLCAPACADASTFVWNGEAGGGSAAWSDGANWGGSVGPLSGGAVVLEFPRLAGFACTAKPPTAACYASKNDLAGLSVGALRLDDGNDYELKGDAVTLGEGGLAASPAAGSTGRADDTVVLPIRLGAPQAWSIAGCGAGGLEENGVVLGGGISGESDTLTVGLSSGGGLSVAGNTEVGELTFEGASRESTNVVGLVGRVNAVDDNPVRIDGLVALGAAVTGPLIVEDAALAPAPVLTSTSMTFTSNSGVSMAIIGDGSTAGEDYTQLQAVGPVDLGGAKLTVEARSAGNGGACPNLGAAQSYTLLSTTGTLTGTFSNAAEGEEIPIELGAGCSDGPWSMRIVYNRSAADKTVTGTVTVGVPIWSSSELNNLEKVKAIELQEQEEREARERALKARELEIMSERTGVNRNLASNDGTNVRLGSTVLRVRQGDVEAKLRCAGARRCAGTISVRVAGTGRHRRGGARRVLIAAGRFAIAAGRTALVRLKVNAVGLRLLSGGRRLRARITVVPDKGTSAPGWSRAVRLVKARKSG